MVNSSDDERRHIVGQSACVVAQCRRRTCLNARIIACIACIVYMTVLWSECDHNTHLSVSHNVLGRIFANRASERVRASRGTSFVRRRRRTARKPRRFNEVYRFDEDAETRERPKRIQDFRKSAVSCRNVHLFSRPRKT